MSPRNPWTVFSATSTGVVAVFLNISGVNVALPTIARELGASAAQSSWVLLSYMLVTTALILAIGRLADIVGRRPLYLAGYVVFTLATAACALAPGPELLIAARTVQAVGAAALVTNTTALLTDTFPAASLGKGLGLNATVAAVTQALGPLAGGAATTLLGWRGTFLVTLPICLVGLVWSAAVIPRTPRSTAPRERFDGLGALLSALALAATLLTLSPDVLAATGFTGAGPAVVCGVLAALLWVLFVLLQRRRTSPLVDLRVLLDRMRGPLYAAVLLNAAAQYAVVVLASLVLQSTGRHDALAAGLLVSPLALGTTVAAVVAGNLVGRVPARTIVTVGSAFVLVGTLLLAVVLTPDGAYAGVFVGLFAVGAGTGLFMTPGTSLLMLTVPAAQRGIANGVRSALQNVGFLLSTAVALGIATGGLSGADRSDAYAGALSAAPSALATFGDGVRAALVVLAVIAFLALAACVALPVRRVAHVGSTNPEETGDMSVDDYAGAGFGAGLTPGARPALLLVDPARAYTDPDCHVYAGPPALAAAEAMRALLAAARDAGIPVVITRVAIAADGSDAGVFFRKVPGLSAFGPGSPFADYVEGLAPSEGEVEIVKQYPSAYFGTDLAEQLRGLGVDTLLIGGFSTSGCVRASTLDTMQHGFTPFVVTDACGDRDASVQAANLFDMGQKMAELWDLSTAQTYLERVGGQVSVR